MRRRHIFAYWCLHKTLRNVIERVFSAWAQYNNLLLNQSKSSKISVPKSLVVADWICQVMCTFPPDYILWERQTDRQRGRERERALFVLQVLRAYTVPISAIHTVSGATIVAKLLYQWSSVWWDCWCKDCIEKFLGRICWWEYLPEGLSCGSCCSRRWTVTISCSKQICSCLFFHRPIWGVLTFDLLVSAQV